MHEWLRRSLAGVSLLVGSLAFGASATVSKPASQTPIKAAAPSGTDFTDQVLSRAPSGRLQWVFGVALEDDDTPLDRSRPRFMAIDATDGGINWEYDPAGDCAQAWDSHALSRSSRELVATFANGDVAVASLAVVMDGWQPLYHFTCYARLAAADGRPIWLHEDRPAAGEAPVGRRAHAIVISPDDHLLAVADHGESLRVLSLDGMNGSERWARSHPLAGRRLVGAAMDARDGRIAIEAELYAAAASPQFGASTFGMASDGVLSWEHALCGAFWPPDPKSLRILADGSTVVAQGCENARLAIARLDVNGSPVWERQIAIEQGSRAAVDERGDVYALGALQLDGSQHKAAKFRVADGAADWSLPGSLLDPAPNGADWVVTLVLAVQGGRVHASQFMRDRYHRYTAPTRLLQLDAASGQPLGERTLGAIFGSDAWQDNAALAPLPGGEVLLGGLSWGGFLSLARLDASAAPDWTHRHSIAGARWVSLARKTTGMLPSMSGTPGLVLVGNLQGGEYAVLMKLDFDGRVQWQWMPEAHVPGEGQISDMAVDAYGTILLAGRAPDTQRDREAAPFLARIDGATGRTLWQRFGVPGEDDFYERVVLDRSGNPVVLSSQQLQRFNAADGTRLWSRPVPTHVSVARPSLVRDRAGHLIAAFPYAPFGPEAGSPAGVQFARYLIDDGELAWQRRITTGYSESPIALDLLSSGDPVASAEGVGLLRLGLEDGGFRWQRDDIFPVPLLADRDDGVLIAAPKGAWPNRWEVSRIGASGATLWSRDFAEPGAEDGQIDRLALAPEGTLLAAGHDRWENLVGAFRIDVSDGALRWSGAADAPPGWERNAGIPIGTWRGGDGSVFVAATGAYFSWLYRFDGPVAGRIFSDGFD